MDFNRINDDNRAVDFKLEDDNADRVIIDTEDAEASSWQERHSQKIQRKNDIRARIQTAGANATDANKYFIPAKPKPTLKDESEKRVAVYARVSTQSEQQTSSIENQSLYYTKKIEETPNWTLQNIYSDEGKSGTSIAWRPAFQQMLEDARQKKMDMIICASVSRFARNVTDCLDQVSELKTMDPSHPIGVYFETENIYTLDPDSNQAFQIHAMLAAWESDNKSRRMILSYDQRISTGQYPVVDLLGYRHTKDGRLIVHPEEAKTVRFIFLSYLNGWSVNDIADTLTQKQRPTLTGRVDWTAGMVLSVMRNERRWGDLEARKTIVFDYKKKIIIKNNNERCSAYVPNHHEAIVSPEIAKAVRMRTSSKWCRNGVPDMIVIDKGALKGYVCVCPAWNGIDHDTYLQLSAAVYDDEELEKLDYICSVHNGEVNNNVLPFRLSDYHVAPGVFFLNNSMPSITVSKSSIKISRACHKRLDDCEFVDILYHPMRKSVVIRIGTDESDLRFRWKNSRGNYVNSISAKAFCKAIYENMNWREDCRFKFRGITKERDGEKIIMFSLDEPQILFDKNSEKQEMDSNDTAIPFVSYTKADGEEYDAGRSSYGYPIEWKENRVGMNFNLIQFKEKSQSKINAEDITANGIVVENPLIGHLPTRDELEAEIDEILMEM